ncbi:3-oxoacyl-ACP reductase [Limnohabitans sp. 2KL-17]|uniref:SDR family oxidoreductase n=1 Tax=Limnohabitans sp. 2KL-17 TaxID=1100704 RepID=UPI000D38E685|nr:SDR family oxidoreductase [Limnohabitans sp. 2KL-17]PUE56355.1 3-oxoacyl-ACP reductase [Limnohabitans sp. 2KL-17]
MSQIALVTGASSGIGKACAQALLKEGWQVVLVGRRADALATAVAEAGPHAANAHAIPTDLSKEAEVKALFEQIRTRFGRLDLVFNNAGISLPYTLPGDLSGDEWRRAVDINLNGAFYTLSHAFKLMQDQSPQGGRIINNGSISAHVPRPGSIAYTATKHAISGLTRAASLDGRPYNIAVGQIDIGNVASDMTLKMAQGVHQADLSIKAEPRMDMSAVVETFMTMARLPLSANILFTTVMATNMPFVGRG